MGLLDLLQTGMKALSDGGAPPSPGAAGPSSAGAAPGGIGAALSAAMHSSQTPPFGEYVGQLFGQSSPNQRAGLLNQMLAAVGPAVLSGVAGGVLGKLLAPGQTQLTPEQAEQVSPQDAAAIAERAERERPGVVDQVAQFYAQHSTLINSLGAAALAAVVAGMKNKDRS